MGVGTKKVGAKADALGRTSLSPKFLHLVASTLAIFVTGNGVKRRVQRDENSRWHHYSPLKRFFA